MAILIGSLVSGCGILVIALGAQTMRTRKFGQLTDPHAKLAGGLCTLVGFAVLSGGCVVWMCLSALEHLR